MRRRKWLLVIGVWVLLAGCTCRRPGPGPAAGDCTDVSTVAVDILISRLVASVLEAQDAHARFVPTATFDAEWRARVDCWHAMLQQVRQRTPKPQVAQVAENIDDVVVLLGTSDTFREDNLDGVVDGVADLKRVDGGG